MKPQYLPFATMASAIINFWLVLSIPSPEPSPDFVNSLGVAVPSTPPPFLTSHMVPLSANTDVGARALGPFALFAVFAGFAVFAKITCKILNVDKVTCVKGAVSAAVVTGWLLILGILRRSSDTSLSFVSDAYRPTVGGNAISAFQAAIPADLNPVHVANQTKDGILHHIYWSSNSTTGLARISAHQRGLVNETDGSLIKRQVDHESNDDGGVVASFDFDPGFAALDDELGEGEGQQLANGAEAELQAQNSILGCAGIGDSSDGRIGINGVVSVGWNDAAFDFGSSGVFPYYEGCLGELADAV